MECQSHASEKKNSNGLMLSLKNNSAEKRKEVNQTIDILKNNNIDQEEEK
jgi:hypothetical protein